MVFVGNTSYHGAVHAQELRPLRQAPSRTHDPAYPSDVFSVPTSIPAGQSRSTSDVLRRLRFVVDSSPKSSSPMRDATYSDPLPSSTSRSAPTSPTRDETASQDLLGLAEDPLPARCGDRRRDRGNPPLRHRRPQTRQDQILRLDSTMAEVKFGYSDKAGEWRTVTTLEEDEYPAYYHQQSAAAVVRRAHRPWHFDRSAGRASNG